MIPQPAWQKPYELGLSRLRTGAVNGALKAFDEALELSGHQIRPLRGKDEVLAVLAGMESAYAGPKKAARVALESAKATEARLFRDLARLPPEVQAFVLIAPGSAASNASALASAQKYLIKIKSRRNAIDYLPPELMTMIGHLAVESEGSSDVAFRLAAVSQRWRTIFIADSLMWGTVTLTRGTQTAAINKVIAFAERRPMRHLTIDYGWSEGQDSILDTLDEMVGDLRSLVVRSPALSLEDLSGLIQGSPTLEKLVVHLPDDLDPEDLFHTGGIYRPKLLSLRRLEIRRHSLDWDWDLLDGIGDRDIDMLLAMFSNLEELLLDHPSVSLLRLDGNDSPQQAAIFHANLRELAIRGRDVGFLVYQTNGIILPKLRKLDLTGSPSESYIPYLFPPGRKPNTQHLTHLFLPDSDVDEDALIGHLPSLVHLTHLDVRQTGIRPDRLVRALADSLKPDRTRALCPVLEKMNLGGGSINLRGEARELVKLRGGGAKLVVKGWDERGKKLMWREGKL